MLNVALPIIVTDMVVVYSEALRKTIYVACFYS